MSRVRATAGPVIALAAGGDINSANGDIRTGGNDGPTCWWYAHAVISCLFVSWVLYNAALLADICFALHDMNRQLRSTSAPPEPESMNAMPAVALVQLKNHGTVFEATTMYVLSDAFHRVYPGWGRADTDAIAAFFNAQLAHVQARAAPSTATKTPLSALPAPD